MKGAQTGVESPELRTMRASQWISMTVVMLVALLSAWLLLKRQSTVAVDLDPTEMASDRFNRWEQPANPPNGLVFDDADVPLVLTLFTSTKDSINIWHSNVMPLELPEGMSLQGWGEGWLFGDRLTAWEMNPGKMARYWSPRKDGRTIQVMDADGGITSTFGLMDESIKNMETTWMPPAPWASASATLPDRWIPWFRSLSEIIAVDDVLEMGSYPVYDRRSSSDPLQGIGRGSWMRLKRADGQIFTAYHGVDSMSVLGLDGKWTESNWIHCNTCDSVDLNWFANTWELRAETSLDLTMDFATAKDGRVSWGRSTSDHRVIWSVERNLQNTSEAQRVDSPASTLAESRTTKSADGLVGVARNHRTGEDMNLIWNAPWLKAMDSNGAEVWKKELSGGQTPQVWEVDLYRNRKYQVVVADESEVHVMDVLGREVEGFPKKWSKGFSAVAVMDYDRNRQYRFLMATPDGRLFNFRKEGERTPGWNFKPSPGRFIQRLAHLRIGNQDFIYAGQDDGSIRLLKRSGEDRFSSPTRVPPNQIPAFRLGKNIAETTVLFVDEDGWIQERTLGRDEQVGMSRMTRGMSVRLEDQDGDGKLEVVVTTAEGEEVWNARNERISPR